MSILIVEDNKASAKLLDVLLKKDGYETIVAFSAKEALEYLFARPSISLVITDLKMPEVDGFMLIKAIRSSPVTERMPVIVCSAVADLSHIKEAIDSGCNHYIVKPIQSSQVLAKVAKIMQEEPSILRSDKAKKQFDLDDKMFREIADAFILLLQDQIMLIEKNRCKWPINLQIINLAESAEIIGAERLHLLLEKRFLGKRSDTPKSYTPDDISALCWEMNAALMELKESRREG
jgi:CheY-like chemotaxis protein